MSPYRTGPPFEPRAADRWLVGFCLLVIVGLLGYVILNGAGLV